MRPRFWSLLIAAFALSACADATGHVVRPRADDARASAKRKSVGVTSKSLEESIVIPAPPAPPTESAEEITRRLREHERPDELLIGITEREATELFGPPHRRHDNATNKTWYYRDGSCGLDLYFYMDMSSRVFRTLAYEVSSDDQSAESRDQCIARLQSAKQSACSRNRQARN